MVSTYLNKNSQIGSFLQVGVKIKINLKPPASILPSWHFLWYFLGNIRLNYTQLNSSSKLGHAWATKITASDSEVVGVSRTYTPEIPSVTGSKLGLIKVADWKMDNEWRCVEHAFPTLKRTFSDCSHVSLLQSKSVPMYLRRVEYPEIKGTEPIWVKVYISYFQFGGFNSSEKNTSTSTSHIQDLPPATSDSRTNPWLNIMDHDEPMGQIWTSSIVIAQGLNRDHPVEPT